MKNIVHMCAHRHPNVSAHSQLITLDLVGAIIEDDLEDIIGGAVGIQHVGIAMVAYKAMIPVKNQDGTVDQLENKFLILPCRQTTLGQTTAKANVTARTMKKSQKSKDVHV